MKKHVLQAEPRKITGRKVKNLRNEGILPANVYGKGVKSQSVQTKLSDFSKVYLEAGETGLVELGVGGKKLPILINNVQTDPVSDSFLHADFYQVNLKEKVAAQVPLELTGESPAEKQGLGTVVKYINEIEVEALPMDLPDKFELDINKLKEVDQAFAVKDLTVDTKKVEIKSDPEQLLVKVEPIREEEEEPEVVTEAEEEPADEEAKEGEAKAEAAEEDIKEEGAEKKEEK